MSAYERRPWTIVIGEPQVHSGVHAQIEDMLAAGAADRVAAWCALGRGPVVAFTSYAIEPESGCGCCGDGAICARAAAQSSDEGDAEVTEIGAEAHKELTEKKQKMKDQETDVQAVGTVVSKQPIRPCPFCGESVVDEIMCDPNCCGDTIWFECQCGAMASTEHAWNNRPLEDAKDAVIARVLVDLGEAQAELLEREGEVARLMGLLVDVREAAGIPWDVSADFLADAIRGELGR